MVLLIIISLLTIYYLGAVMYLYTGLHRLKSTGEPQNLTFSIVIAARNEETNIERCLAAVFSQTIPQDRFEVIVVNDRSTDATAEICSRLTKQYQALSIITIDKTPPGIAPKKYAVSQGVAAASNQVIVQTDADCSVQPTWLDALDRNFTEGTGLVQGITAYEKPEGMSPIFFGLQAVDFLSHGIVAAAAIGAGLPINSNANNFAYRKKAFEEAGGYGSVSAKVVSGDDDLLLQRIASSREWKVVFMADPAGAVRTAPTTTVRGVFEQRKRWGSKTVNYTISQVLFLSGIFLFYCGIFVSLAAGFFSLRYFAVSGGMVLMKMLGEYLLMMKGTAIFDQKKLRPYILPASLIQLPLVMAAVLFGVFGKFSWKSETFRRKVK